MLNKRRQLNNGKDIKTFLYGVILLIIFIIVFISSNNAIPTAVFADNDT